MWFMQQALMWSCSIFQNPWLLLMNVKKKSKNKKPFIFLSRFWFLAPLSIQYGHLGIAFRGKISHPGGSPLSKAELPTWAKILWGLQWLVMVTREWSPKLGGYHPPPSYFMAKSHTNPTSSPSNIHSSRWPFLTMDFVVAEFQNDPQWSMLLYDPLPVHIGKPVNMMTITWYVKSKGILQV